MSGKQTRILEQMNILLFKIHAHTALPSFCRLLLLNFCGALTTKIAGCHLTTWSWTLTSSAGWVHHYNWTRSVMSVSVLASDHHSARDLGETLDSLLTMKHHTNSVAVARSCFY